jgi:putative membrane protein
VAQRRALIRRCIWQSGAFWMAISVVILQLLWHKLIETAVITFDTDFDIHVFLTIVNAGATLVYVVCAIAFLFNIVGAILWYRTSSFAYNDAFMTIKNGGLTTEAISLPRKKIQFGYTSSNPFQRLSKVASINVVTAAGVSNTHTKLVDASAADAAAWITWLKPGGNKDS